MNNVAGGIRVARTRPRERACVRAPTRAHTMADRGTRGIEGYVFSSRARERAICSSLTCVHAVSRVSMCAWMSHITRQLNKRD